MLFERAEDHSVVLLQEPSALIHLSSAFRAESGARCSHLVMYYTDILNDLGELPVPSAPSVSTAWRSTPWRFVPLVYDSSVELFLLNFSEAFSLLQ